MRVDSGGIGLHVEVDGSDDGPPVLLLHGWPDTSAVWRHQVAPLVDAGFRVIRPDLRGFGASDRPDGVDSYSLLFLVADALAVLDELGIERAHVVGHDWGSALAWSLAAFAPDRVDHLVGMSVGHPAAFAAMGMDQREKSWYMLLFQFEGVAEQWLSDDGFANFREWSRHPEADEVASRMAEPGALTASLNLYRANVPPSALVGPPLEFPPIAAPTMGIWSDREFALTEGQMTGSAAHLTGTWRYERVAGHDHWLTLEAPEVVNGLLLDFLPVPAPA